MPRGTTSLPDTNSRLSPLPPQWLTDCSRKNCIDGPRNARQRPHSENCSTGAARVSEDGQPALNLSRPPMVAALPGGASATHGCAPSGPPYTPSAPRLSIGFIRLAESLDEMSDIAASEGDDIIPDDRPLRIILFGSQFASVDDADACGF